MKNEKQISHGQFKEIDGDLIELFKKGEFDVIAHGCNCYATMGAGIALTIGKQFPEAKVADIVLDIPNGKKRLGKLSFAEIDIPNKKGYDNSLLFNLYTQYNPGPDFRFEAFVKSIRAMRKVIKQEFSYKEDGKTIFKPDTIKIGLPLIGCGIAGGDWEQVKASLMDELSGFDVTIIHFKQQVVGVNYWPKREKRQKVDWGTLTDEEFEEILKDM